MLFQVSARFRAHLVPCQQQRQSSCWSSQEHWQGWPCCRAEPWSRIGPIKKLMWNISIWELKYLLKSLHLKLVKNFFELVVIWNSVNFVCTHRSHHSKSPESRKLILVVLDGVVSSLEWASTLKPGWELFADFFQVLRRLAKLINAENLIWNSICDTSTCISCNILYLQV